MDNSIQICNPEVGNIIQKITMLPHVTSNVI